MIFRQFYDAHSITHKLFARGAVELARSGFTRVFNLRGGMQAYAASSLPIEFGA